MSTKNPTYGYGHKPLTPAQAKLVADNIGLCYAMLRQYSSIPADRWDEVIAEAALPGLIGAARRFDPAKGKFATLACHAIIHHIHTTWRRQMTHSNRWHQWAEAEKGGPAELVQATKEGENPTAADDLKVLLACLPAKMRMVVELKYLSGLQHREIAELMGCALVDSYRLFAEGMRRLRKRALLDAI